VANEEKYKLGRTVVQTVDYYGLLAPRVGWVTDVWPNTKVLFEDGRETCMSMELDSVCTVTDDFVEDIEGLREQVLESVRGHRVSRKTPYTEVT
jgi:hypothetical protein